MSLVTKIMSYATAASPVEKAVGYIIAHILAGDRKGAITGLLTLVEAESEGHAQVVSELRAMQATLSTVGLADPPAAVAAPPPTEAAGS